MSYIDDNLTAGETIAHKAKLHWIIYVDAIVMIIAAMVLVIASQHPVVLGCAGVLAIGALIRFSTALLKVRSTEFAVTNKRVIGKTGLVSLKSVDLKLSKLESIVVEQTALGRMLGYGTVMISGTGTGWEKFEHISAPLELRKKSLESQDASPESAATSA